MRLEQSIHQGCACGLLLTVFGRLAHSLQRGVSRGSSKGFRRNKGLCSRVPHLLRRVGKEADLCTAENLTSRWLHGASCYQAGGKGEGSTPHSCRSKSMLICAVYLNTIGEANLAVAFLHVIAELCAVAGGVKPVLKYVVRIGTIVSSHTCLILHRMRLNGQY